ncbi:MAG: hypothetical protein K9M54_05735 [Kiritimatiellales bacterium]|nr:hypothetical protein [Kiritimatiellales bacterium]
MSFNQTRDILDHARDFHRRLGEFYAELLDRAPDEETRELLDNLMDHEHVLERRLKEYEEEVSKNVLDTFFKYMVGEREDCFGEYAVPSLVGTEYVIEATRHFDRCLCDFYKEMARKALAEQVREVLLNLLEMELREQMTLSKKVLELVVVA